MVRSRPLRGALRVSLRGDPLRAGRGEIRTKQPRPRDAYVISGGLCPCPRPCAPCGALRFVRYYLPPGAGVPGGFWVCPCPCPCPLCPSAGVPLCGALYAPLRGFMPPPVPLPACGVCGALRGGLGALRGSAGGGGSAPVPANAPAGAGAGRTISLLPPTQNFGKNLKTPQKRPNRLFIVNLRHIEISTICETYNRERHKISRGETLKE